MRKILCFFKGKNGECGVKFFLGHAQSPYYWVSKGSTAKDVYAMDIVTDASGLLAKAESPDHLCHQHFLEPQLQFHLMDCGIVRSDQLGRGDSLSLCFQAGEKGLNRDSA
ncbi:MAG TPA: hypothetical protein PKI59_03460 [Candidatus Cloacimonadota bacterium]|nr:hypothetical protein [Candidatus Cloacimonadota bacterium]